MLLADERDHELLGHALERLGHPQALPLRVRPQGPAPHPAAPRARKTEQGQQMKSLCVGLEPNTFNANCPAKSLQNEKMEAPIGGRSQIAAAASDGNDGGPRATHTDTQTSDTIEPP